MGEELNTLRESVKRNFIVNTHFSMLDEVLADVKNSSRNISGSSPSTLAPQYFQNDYAAKIENLYSDKKPANEMAESKRDQFIRGLAMIDKANEKDLKALETQQRDMLLKRLETEDLTLFELDPNNVVSLSKEGAGKLLATPPGLIERAYYESLKEQSYLLEEEGRKKLLADADTQLNRVNQDLAGITGETNPVERTNEAGLPPLPKDPAPNLSDEQLADMRESTKTLYAMNERLAALDETLIEMNNASFGARQSTGDTLTPEYFKNALNQKLIDLDPAEQAKGELAQSKRNHFLDGIAAIDKMPAGELQAFSNAQEARLQEQLATNNVVLESLDYGRGKGEASRRMLENMIATESPIIERNFVLKQQKEILFLDESERAMAQAMTSDSLERINKKLAPFASAPEQDAKDLVPLPRDPGEQPKVVAPPPFKGDFLEPEQENTVPAPKSNEPGLPPLPRDAAPSAKNPVMSEEEARNRFFDEFKIPEEEMAIPRGENTPDPSSRKRSDVEQNDWFRRIPLLNTPGEKRDPSSRKPEDLKKNPNFIIPHMEGQPLFNPKDTIKSTSTTPMSKEEALAEFAQLVQPEGTIGGKPLLASTNANSKASGRA